MNDTERIAIVKSDHEQVIDLATTLIGLAVLVYSLHPDPFNDFFTQVRARWHAWVHRVSVWEALHAIRSLPETDKQ